MNKPALCLVVFSLVASGCNVNDIRVRDRVSFNNLETSLAIPDSDHLRVRLRGSKASGNSRHSVVAGDLIRIEDSPFFGPLEYDSAAEVSYFSVAIGRDEVHADFFPGKVNVSSYFGLARTDFDLSLQHQGNTYTAADTTTELYLQYALSNAFNDWLSGGLSYALSYNFDSVLSREIDLLMELKISREFRLTGGYRWYEYSYDNFDTNNSTINLEFSGPFLGINLPF
ncbi:MAG: hypothetical protein ACI9LO_002559 [Planctomycetota bacterium]|jgi:hypothetical protein